MQHTHFFNSLPTFTLRGLSALRPHGQEANGFIAVHLLLWSLEQEGAWQNHGFILVVPATPPPAVFLTQCGRKIEILYFKLHQGAFMSLCTMHTPAEHICHGSPLFVL